jgi:hypothetical protein
LGWILRPVPAAAASCSTFVASESELELESRPLVVAKYTHLSVTRVPADCRCGSWLRCSADMLIPPCPVFGSPAT